MKMRYFLLPVIIISLMLFILDSEDTAPVNKSIASDSLDISYPFFGNDVIDEYIMNYLEDYWEKEHVFIDYDYYNNNSSYYMTFYSYIFDGNMLSNNIDSFLIDVDNSTIVKTEDNDFAYDPITNNKSYKEDKLVALTFDDGPNYNTNRILNILNKYNVKATFFVLGTKIKGNEYILQKMFDSGMEIGNHTFNHLLLTKYSEDKIKEEIESTSNLIYNVIGKKPMLLRPSYGSFNNKIKKVTTMPIIIWNIDTLDWKYHNSKRISNRIFSKVKDGDIVLMHDIYSATANALDIIIPRLLNDGYKLVTVSELFYYKEISLESGKVYGYAR